MLSIGGGPQIQQSRSTIEELALLPTGPATLHPCPRSLTRLCDEYDQHEISPGRKGKETTQQVLQKEGCLEVHQEST